MPCRALQRMDEVEMLDAQRRGYRRRHHYAAKRRAALIVLRGQLGGSLRAGCRGYRESAS